MAASTKARDIAAEADEYVEVKGSGGDDFPGTHDFAADGDLIGVFLGTETKDIKGKQRTIHTFEVDGEPVTAWGTAILDSRLSELDGSERPHVKIVRPGTKVATKSGHQAWEFNVFVKASALNPRR